MLPVILSALHTPSASGGVIGGIIIGLLVTRILHKKDQK